MQFKLYGLTATKLKVNFFITMFSCFSYAQLSYLFVCKYVGWYVCACVRMCIQMYVRIHVGMYASLYVSARMCVRMFVCIYVYMAGV